MSDPGHRRSRLYAGREDALRPFVGREGEAVPQDSAAPDPVEAAYARGVEDGRRAAERDALDLVIVRVLAVVDALARFAEAWADEPTLGMTHFQPAQPTTVGKRACLWLQDFLLDLERLRFERGRLALRGAKGTTGTQATLL